MIRSVAKASWEQLLAVEHEDGVAGVYCDRANGTCWLSGDENGGSGMTEQRFTSEGLHNAWVYGGFLPAAATRVHARDAHAAWSEGVVGNGVWLAITRAMPLAARFEDARGSVVPRPLDALEREPVPDATAPCAACGGPPGIWRCCGRFMQARASTAPSSACVAGTRWPWVRGMRAPATAVR